MGYTSHALLDMDTLQDTSKCKNKIQFNKLLPVSKYGGRLLSFKSFAYREAAMFTLTFRVYGVSYIMIC